MADRPSYGDHRRLWHEAFVEYMYEIVNHPNYAGMPCTIDSYGKIDWTIPSNRTRGSKNWDGNLQRRHWWQQKANSLGIPREGRWMSSTAKQIHPFGEKPCQTCGNVMELAYVYPTTRTLEQLNRNLPASRTIQVEWLWAIDEVVAYFFDELGVARALVALRQTFPETGSTAADPNEITRSIRSAYCERESRKFSPGVMANPPDRLDGFHTYNLCCRSRQDTGRAAANLATYGIDRRAYEQWCEGDWNLANVVMTQAGAGACEQCGEVTQLSADHIGPISLGFCHSPYFRPLCQRCNSGKNNRMSLVDVRDLLALEAQGSKVVSWQAQTLWDAVKNRISDNREALLLSKLLRINQHHYLKILGEAIHLGVPDVLLGLVHPEHSYYRVTLMNFDPSTLRFDEVALERRQDTYARMRAARSIRIAFDALLDYGVKLRRNIQIVPTRLVRIQFEGYLAALTAAGSSPDSRRSLLTTMLQSKAPAEVRDAILVGLDTASTTKLNEVAVAQLRLLMDAYALHLVARFNRQEAVSWHDLTED